MAQAQVTITAVDRTQAAINSAMRSMKTLERTAKVTAKAVNLAFGFFTGGILINAFGKIIDAAKKTREGAESVENLKKVLQDPALVASAQSLTKILIDGFVVAAGGVVAFTKLVRNELLTLGAIEAKTSDDAIKVLESKIDAIRKKYRYTVKGETISSPITRADLDLISEYEKRISLLSDPLQRGRGEGGKSGRVFISKATEQDRMEAYSAILRGRLELEKKLQEQEEKREKESLKLFEQQIKKMAELQSFYDELKKAPEMLEVNFSAADVTIANSVQNILDEMDRADKIMQKFAESAAQNIQSAFADFLFDPFKDGLRGMLSAFVDVIRRMIAEILAQQILTAIFSSFAGGTGFMASFAKAITGRASGGPVSAGRPYIVGERGPELFVPGSSGGIVPNHAMGGMTVAPVYNIDARGATADLQAALPGILQENNRRIFEELDRRYGVGR